jgi:uncharacterized protein (TIGR00730 family)
VPLFLLKKTIMIEKVTVYLASSDKVDQKYFTITEELANILAENKITTVYGGSSMGLMGKLANTLLAKNGKVIGIMPKFMIDVEWSHPNLSELILVEDMRQRKEMLLENIDALIALPGGCGTLEELSEAITLKRLGKFTKPIIILNTDGFYDHLIALFDKMIEEKFLRPEHRDIWTVINQPSEMIDAIKNAPKWTEEAIKFAAI